MSARAELLDGIIIRLGRRDVAQWHFPNGLLVPDRDDFGLSDAEKAEAQQPSGCGALSVWDVELTAPEQASRFLDKPKARIVLTLEVPRILALTHDLHIVRKPEERPLPGADGHCLLQDVWSNDRRIRQAIQSDLVNLSKPIGTVTAEHEFIPLAD
jgi:hypothetical protein